MNQQQALHSKLCVDVAVPLVCSASPPPPGPPPPSPPPPGPPPPSPPPPDVCFPSHATVQAADGRSLAMRDLRTGDRVLAVGWDGKPRYEEV
jgi:hypothetical protein